MVDKSVMLTYRPSTEEELLDKVEQLRKQLDAAMDALNKLDNHDDFEVHLIARKAKDRIFIIQRESFKTHKKAEKV